jgi:hypothetical protein
MYGNDGALCNGVVSIAVDLRDRDDALRPIGSLDAPISYSGGVGVDLIIYPGQSAGFSLSGDGVANDGPAGKDNIGPLVERLYGTPFADSLSTVSGAALVAGDGDDTLSGGPHNDRLEAAYVEDVGVDSGTFYALGKDTLDCGGGEDFALMDHGDTVDPDCEVVAVDNAGRGGFSVHGSAHGDVIGPLPYGWGPAVVRASDGKDTIRTSGVAVAYGGGGNDRIIGFDQAAQTFYGGRGSDHIDVRDKRPAKFNRDVVRCGIGKHDLVYANANDTVARDCEHVRRY